MIGAGQSDLDSLLIHALATQGRVASPEEAPEKGHYFRSDHFNSARAGVPASGLALWVQAVDGRGPAWGLNPEQPMSPASVFKLATTTAALDVLGPAWTWRTPVAFTGPVDHGVLRGSLVIRGGGDPGLVLERLWLLLRRVRDAGVRDIRGDIVLDHGPFAPNAPICT